MMSGEMKISKRKEIFAEFKNAEIGIICSSRVLNEGVDLPFIDTIMFVEPRKSTIDIVQCIGRGLRKYSDLEKCNVLLPIYYDKISKSSTFQCVLDILMAMIEFDKSLKQQFTPKSIEKKEDAEDDEEDENDENDEDKDEKFEIPEKIEMVQFDLNEVDEAKNEFEAKKLCNDLEDVVNNRIFQELRLKILDSRSQIGRSISFQYNKSLLFEWCDKNKKYPHSKSPRYKNKHIGRWLEGKKILIESKEDKRYIKLSANEYVKQSLDKHLSNRKRPRLTNDEKIQKLFEYCDKYKKCPTKNTKNMSKIARWLHFKKSTIKSTKDKSYIQLSKNKYVKQSLDKYLLDVDKKSLLFEWCDENEQFPKSNTMHKDYNIGQFLSDEKKKIKSKKDALYIELSANKYVKQSLDALLLSRQNKSGKKLKFPQSKKLLFEWCNQNKQSPKYNTKHNGYNIGKFLTRQKEQSKSKKDGWKNRYIELSENKYVKEWLDKRITASKNTKKGGQKRKEYNEYEQDAIGQSPSKKQRIKQSKNP
eukprot:158132_1